MIGYKQIMIEQLKKKKWEEKLTTFLKLHKLWAAKSTSHNIGQFIVFLEENEKTETKIKEKKKKMNKEKGIMKIKLSFQQETTPKRCK